MDKTYDKPVLITNSRLILTSPKTSRAEVTRVHCSICGQISPEDATNFEKRMAWLRRHRKEMHPAAFKKSVKKAVKTRKMSST